MARIDMPYPTAAMLCVATESDRHTYTSYYRGSKCGKLKLIFCPSAGGKKKKTIKKLESPHPGPPSASTPSYFTIPDFAVATSSKGVGGLSSSAALSNGWSSLGRKSKNPASSTPILDHPASFTRKTLMKPPAPRKRDRYNSREAIQYHIIAKTRYT